MIDVMSLADDVVGATGFFPERAPDRHLTGDRDPRQNRRSRKNQARRNQVRWVAGATAALVLTAVMAWPGSAQSTTSSSTTAPSSTTTAAPSTTATTAAPTTATTAAPTSATTATTAAPPTTAPPTTAGSTTAGPTTTAAPTAPTTAAPPTDSQPATTGGDTTTSVVDAAERERIEAAAAAKAREVDAANARLGDLSGALATLNQRVTSQSGRVDYANQQVEAAEAFVAASEAAVAEAEADLVELERRLRVQAINAFMGDDSEQAAVLVTGDPNRSIRMFTMLAEVTQSDIDFAGTLVAANEDLEVQRAEALNAVEEAEALRAEAAQQLEILQVDLSAQRKLTFSAESRLDHLLSERAALAALGAGDGSPTADEAELVSQLLNASTSAPSAPRDNVPVPNVVSESEIRLAGKGIRVHESIVDSVQQLLTDAEAAGYDLAGGGYRDPAGQIAVRRSNCGTSNYAIYEMPASQCRPPTARPGQSMHERGMAIDFTYRGALIRSRSSAAFVWLSQNAAKYGLYNLPSEPWHWSTNGR